MKMYLSHETALEFWRLQRNRNPKEGKRRAAVWNPKDPSIFQERPSALDVADVPADLSRPIHVLIPDQSLRSKRSDIVSHVRSQDLPRGSFLEVSNTVSVASPSLCFAQNARTLTLPRAARLGLEFCGAYRLKEEDYLDGSPLVRQAAPSEYLLGLQNAAGAEKARFTLRYVADGSASPRETVVFLLLCLPPKYGGYGLPVPLMNAHIGVDARIVRSVSKSYFKCDLYWPDAHVAAEYDSDLAHTGADRIAKDAQRRNSLEHLGVSVVAITNNQVFDFTELDRSVKQIAKKIGVRVRPRCSDWRAKQRSLRAQLMRF